MQRTRMCKEATHERGLYSFCFAKPGSTTYLMPSMVNDVSAMLVASTTLRAPGGVFSKILACSTNSNDKQIVVSNVYHVASSGWEA